MAYRGAQGGRVQKALVQPIDISEKVSLYNAAPEKLLRWNVIFKFLQNKTRVQIWLYEQCNLRIEGYIIGFDEYMNLVLSDAEERHMKTGGRKSLGRILLKGETITLIQAAEV